jgi:glutamine amidotransferase
MITIVDYGLGNLASIANMIKKVGGQAEITADETKILNATKLLLPGVGHFQKGMENLNRLGFAEIIKKRALQDKIPLMGICLGMQLLTNHSEEGDVKGLGLIDANTIKFNSTEIYPLKVPNMGWNDVMIKPHKLFDHISEIPRYYFVHSYYVKCAHRENSIATCNYGITYDCAIAKDNIFGTQFHPEKSHRFGMQIIKNFIENF